MIAEIVDGAFDPTGKEVFRPDTKRSGIRPTFPIGRFVNAPLSVKCESVEDVRLFLCGCNGVTDKELFGKEEYWNPPDQFEKIRKGDCEDFALWTWCQLLSLGYDARLVIGLHGRYGVGHAWCVFSQNGRMFLVEPTMAKIASRLPALSTLSYVPEYSIAVRNGKPKYFQHRKLNSSVAGLTILRHLPEWLLFWSWFWARNVHRLPLGAIRMIRKRTRTNS